MIIFYVLLVKVAVFKYKIEYTTSIALMKFLSHQFDYNTKNTCTFFMDVCNIIPKQYGAVISEYSKLHFV